MSHLEIINEVCTLLDTKEVYLVGGSVRDILLGKQPKDYDFCTPLLPDELGKVSFDEVGKVLNTLLDKIDKNINVLPEKPEIEFWENYLVNLYKKL